MDKNSETTTVSILKHDNDDDGEDGAGARLAQLLQMRQEMNVLVVVSRWFGGIHLGPRRFAHITSVAQAALSEFHGEIQTSKTFKN
jgi:putative IMPACT (imprinted ancient) family translation regulator